MFMTRPHKYHINSNGKPLCQCVEEEIHFCYQHGNDFFKTHLCRSEDWIMLIDICDECYGEWCSWIAEVEVQKQIEDKREAIRSAVQKEQFEQREGRIKDLLDGCG
jgi:hypothetical protein